MLGRHHLLLSVATVGLVVAPLFTTYPNVVLLAIAGCAIGSLVPDADSPDAAIFHPEVRGLKGSRGEALNAIAPIFPAFGYTTKYLIYKPAVKLYDAFVFDQYDIEERHRGFLHSFLGLGTATVVTGVYLIVALLLLGLFSILHLAVFLAAYLAGAVLHLAEDSCTKTGIQWNFPFQDWEINGQLTTTARPEDTRYQNGFLTILGVVAAGLFLLSAMYPDFPAIALSITGAVLGAVLWLIFGRLVAKCRVVRPGR